MLATMANPGSELTAYSRPAEPCPQVTIATVGFDLQERDKWRKVRRALEPLKRLRDDWDGLGASAPLPGVIDTALDLATYMGQRNHLAPTTAAPTPAGTILFTWDDTWGNVRYFELEIRAPNWLTWMQIDVNGSITHGQWLDT